AELFSLAVGGFRNSVCIEYKRVTRLEPYFCDLAFPVFEQSQNGTRGVQPYSIQLFSSGTKQERGQMATIRVVEPESCIVIIGKKKCGIAGVIGAVIKEAVYRGQQAR